MARPGGREPDFDSLSGGLRRTLVDYSTTGNVGSELENDSGGLQWTANSVPGSQKVRGSNPLGSTKFLISQSTIWRSMQISRRPADRLSDRLSLVPEAENRFSPEHAQFITEHPDAHTAAARPLRALQLENVGSTSTWSSQASAARSPTDLTSPTGSTNS